MVTKDITSEQKVAITVSPVTAAGSPASLDGAVSFSILSGDCTLEPIDDKSVFVVSGLPDVDSVIGLSADADLGAGVVNITDTVTISVKHPMATSLGVSVGEPVNK